MEIRKAVTGGVMIAAMGAAGLGFAGAASATPPQSCHYNCPKPSSQTTVIKKTTVTKTSNVSVADSQLGAGNVSQQANGQNAGAINNPQIGLGAISVPVTAQVPINAPSGTTGNNTSSGGTVKHSFFGSADAKGETEAGNQSAKQDVVSVAKNNESNNSSSVNNASTDNNSASVKVGNVS